MKLVGKVVSPINYPDINYNYFLFEITDAY